jgi:hypothetical protein
LNGTAHACDAIDPVAPDPSRSASMSVIVTIVDGGDTLASCLHGLASQQSAPPFEVIIPWDDSLSGIPELKRQFPAYQFLAMGSVITARPAKTHAGQHELFDRRRAAGLAAAAGSIIAILEDRGVPRPDWARQLFSLHQRLPHGVIGGAIEIDGAPLLNWAVYLCDFGRFGLPFAAGPREWVSDINIAYKRTTLDGVRDLWRDRYHETTVNWALRRKGETLYLAPEAVVDQHRGSLRLGDVLAERFAWGRLFAATRARESSALRRFVLTVLAPALPVLLFARHARLQLPRRPGLFIRASPLLLLLLIASSAGEAAGYATADG